MKWRIGVKMLGFKKTYTLPFKFDIPNYTREFLKKESVIKCWLKFIKRQTFITLKKQKSLEITNILPEHKNILWVNISAPRPIIVKSLKITFTFPVMTKFLKISCSVF